MPAIDSQAVRAYLIRCAESIRRHEAYLTRLDAVLGDGDHGDNLAIGFAAVLDELDRLDPAASPGAILRHVGHTLVASVGGASGPLYGTALIGAGLVAGEADVLDEAAAARMLDAAAEALARRGRCTIGDKTIYDTLRPAADAFGQSVVEGADWEDALSVAVRAAAAGMRSTRPLVARRGLALRLGPRSAGHLDPGAVSCFLLVRAAAPSTRRASDGSAVASSIAGT